MQEMGEGACPFEFNTDPAAFKVGDAVSYRVTGSWRGCHLRACCWRCMKTMWC